MTKTTGNTAHDYSLAVSENSGTVYIVRCSKKDPTLMTEDRRVVPDGEFAGLIMEWMLKQIGDSDEKTVVFYHADGNPIAELKFV